MEPLDTSIPDGKADLGKRFLALLIDGILVAVFVGVLFAVAGYRGMGIGYLIGVAYYLVRDGITNNFMDMRSIGKKVMKLRAIPIGMGAMTLDRSIRRNWTLVIGMTLSGLSYLFFGWRGSFGILANLAWLGSLLGLVEGILVITDPQGRRIGDKQADTVVIETGE